MIRQVVILSIFSLSLFGTNLLKLQVNKNHTFLTFVESLAKKKYVSNVPRRIYLSQYKNDIAIFVKLHNEIAKSNIKEYKKSKNLLQAMYIESLNYKSFDKFEKKIKTIKLELGKRN